MTEAYLARWTWVSDADGDNWQAPDVGAVGSLDLRSIPQMSLAGGVPQGWSIFTYPAPVVIPNALALGSDLLANLSNPTKNAIRNRLGLPSPLSANTLVDILWEILTTQADPTGLLRCKPLMPTIQGNLELWLGGFSLIKGERFNTTHSHWPQVLAVLHADYRRLRAEYQALGLSDVPKKVLGGWMRKYHVQDHRVFIPADLPDEGWEPPATTITDNFNRANQTGLGTSAEGWSWTAVQGAMNIVTNRAQDVAAAGVGSQRAESDLSSEDHYAQCLDHFTADTARIHGPCVEFAAAATTYYQGDMGASGGFKVLKVVAGVQTSLGSGTGTDPGAGSSFTVRLTKNGSTLTLAEDGTTRVTVTDTAITGNLRCGISERTANANRSIMDDFEAADLTAVSGPPAGSLGLLGVGV